jgi:hypothetical protein
VVRRVRIQRPLCVAHNWIVSQPGYRERCERVCIGSFLLAENVMT